MRGGITPWLCPIGHAWITAIATRLPMTVRVFPSEQYLRIPAIDVDEAAAIELYLVVVSVE
jgi:hypothetical protein